MTIKLEINGRQIARVDVVNVSNLAEVSDYECVVSQDDADAPALSRRFSVSHRRSDGALKLARKVLEVVA